MKTFSLIHSMVMVITLAVVFTSCDDDCISGSGSTVTRELEMPDIYSVSLLGSEKLVITRGTEQKVVVEAQENIIDRINTDVEGGHWDAFVRDCVRRSGEITYYVTVPSLEYIGLSGSGKVVTVGDFEAEDMSIILSGSGKIEAYINTESLYANITGSGKIEVSGFAQNSDVKVSGSGRFRGFDLYTEYTSANITGSGDAEVNVDEYLDARISGSGNVIYRGNPTVDADITGSGKVKRD